MDPRIITNATIVFVLITRAPLARISWAQMPVSNAAGASSLRGEVSAKLGLRGKAARAGAAGIYARGQASGRGGGGIRRHTNG
jgi:hypothetical protein